MRQEVARFVMIAAALAGCAPVTTGAFLNTGSQEFFGRYVEPAPEPAAPSAAGAAGRQGGDAITAQGSAIAQLGRDEIAIHVTNHGRRPIRLSYALDEFSAVTANGRAVTLEKQFRDFLYYPEELKPSSEATLRLWLPQSVPLTDVTQLLIKLDDGRLPVVLRPVGPRHTAVVDGPRQWPSPPSAPGISGGVAGAGSAAERPAVIEPIPVPVVPEPTGGPAPVAEPPVGTVPTTVEFQQELGSSLKVDVRWDRTEAVTTLAPGEHRMFYVVPGQHELHFVSRIPSIGDTSGSVPVAISAEAPIKILLSGQAKLSGPVVQVRIWKGQDLVFDHRFMPPSGG